MPEAGFLASASALLAAFRSALSPFVPLILLGVFVIDASLTLAKRILRRDQWYAPHRSHAFQHLARRFGHECTTLFVSRQPALAGPWAALAQWRPAYALLCLAAAWTPLIVVAQLLRAGESAGPWRNIDRAALPPIPASSLLGSASLGRAGASLLTRVYGMMEKNGFVAKHLVLAVLNFGCVYLALLTRFDGAVPSVWIASLPLIALTWSLFQGAVLLLFRASRSHWRFTSAEELPK